MLSKRKRFYAIPFLILIALPLLGLIVMLLWNAILPDLLGVKHISFWQSVGLLVLCKILFGFRGGGGGGFRGGPPWKQKLMNMTPEERERFKQEWQQRWTDPGKDRC